MYGITSINLKIRRIIMISKKRHLIWGGVFIAIVSLLVATPFGSTTMVKEAMAKSEWVWSKENPKPVW